MRSPEEMKKLAMDCMEGRVFGTWQLPNPDDIGMVFPILMMMKPEDLQQMGEQGVVHFYEFMDKAAPRAVNGYPMFFSCHKLTMDEAEQLDVLIAKLTEQRDAFLNG